MTAPNSSFSPPDWKKITYLTLVSRSIDKLEETKLVPEKKVLYQFSAGGHEVSQIILGHYLTHPHDAVSAYYRSRPLLLSLGLDIEDALASPMGKSGGFSNGRDIGVVCNLARKTGPIALPMAGDVGSQFTPAAGWAQALLYRKNILKEDAYANSISVVHAGDGAIATNGFWSSLTIATTLKLPLLFFIEDNGFGISVPGDKQTPGGNIAENLASFKNLFIKQGDGTNPQEILSLLEEALTYVRAWKGPAFLHLKVPRLSGHSGQDTQAYKSQDLLTKEKENDPILKLKNYLVPKTLSKDEWDSLQEKAEHDVYLALEGALSRPEPDLLEVRKYIFAEVKKGGEPDNQLCGGLASQRHVFPPSSSSPKPEPTRINMLTAIRRTLEQELRINSKVLIFGEDVGPKGGVHAATLGLQDTFGEDRVFDTSLSEEGIIGRAVGMSLAGLMPVAEIQFRKYADPATEQLHNCGTIRWRTYNHFAAPIVVRMPGGFGSKCGDPWHSVCDEVFWAHSVGWQMCFPSNAEDAVGLLRTAMRSNNPTIFFEHRALLDSPSARQPYPGDDFALPFGKAKIVQEGGELTIVTWGAMVERAQASAEVSGASIEIIDLRTIVPWDKEAVLSSIKKTRRCLVVHEDGLTSGFGAEISAIISEHAFFSLDAPIMRMAVPDVPIPYNVGLMNAVLPSVEGIGEKIREILER